MTVEKLISFTRQVEKNLQRLQERSSFGGAKPEENARKLSLVAEFNESLSVFEEKRSKGHRL